MIPAEASHSDAPAKKGGITPACAGKRKCAWPFRCTCRDHPRACGEKPAAELEAAKQRGSPPRVRGKVRQPAGQVRHQGITPARAGKVAAHLPERPGDGITPARAGKSTETTAPRTMVRDHPRACGEKLAAELEKARSEGSPPRVRGKGWNASRCAPCPGITPARAGKRICKMQNSRSARDHPRACGEKMV